MSSIVILGAGIIGVPTTPVRECGAAAAEEGQGRRCRCDKRRGYRYASVRKPLGRGAPLLCPLASAGGRPLTGRNDRDPLRPSQSLLQKRLDAGVHLH